MNYLLEGDRSNRLLFRKLVPSDYYLWLPFHEDPRSSENWIGESLEPELACCQWFSKAFYRYENNLGGLNALIDNKTGDLIGQCGLLLQTVDGNKEVEIGYSILPSHWNEGYATEAAIKCKTHAFEKLHIKSLISIIHINNIASRQVALKIGMYWEKTTIYDGNPVAVFRIFR